MTHYDLVALAARVMAGAHTEAHAEVRAAFNAAYPVIHAELGSGALSWTGTFFFELDEYLNNEDARRAGAGTVGKLADSYRDFLFEAAKRV